MIQKKMKFGVIALALLLVLASIFPGTAAAAARGRNIQVTPLNIDAKNQLTIAAGSLTISFDFDVYGEASTVMTAVDAKGRTGTAELPGYIYSAYVISRGKKAYLLASFDYASDDLETWVYAISGSKLKKKATQQGGIENIEETTITLGSYVDMLGTWPAVRNYTMRLSSGRLRAAEAYWTLQLDGFEPEHRYLIVKRDVAATLTNITENREIEASMNPGEKIIPLAANKEKGIFYFAVDDIWHGAIQLRRAHGFWGKIGKLDAEEYFEELRYSG